MKAVRKRALAAQVRREGGRAMKPTNEERREVARRLRVNAEKHPDIADLIEPEPERTCRDEGTSAFRCGRCGAFALRDAITDLCGPIPIRYCPNCGAKAVGE